MHPFRFRDRPECHALGEKTVRSSEGTAVIVKAVSLTSKIDPSASVTRTR
ncbi:MAG: hypothetical protein GY950_32995 [bacterium]|nr:hypothetical protein [bacterium]